MIEPISVPALNRTRASSDLKSRRRWLTDGAQVHGRGASNTSWIGHGRTGGVDVFRRCMICDDLTMSSQAAARARSGRWPSWLGGAAGVVGQWRVGRQGAEGPAWTPMPCEGGGATRIRYGRRLVGGSPGAIAAGSDRGPKRSPCQGR
jgi:hypothetical protein